MQKNGFHVQNDESDLQNDAFDVQNEFDLQKGEISRVKPM